jgi:hypothetical protein
MYKGDEEERDGCIMYSSPSSLGPGMKMKMMMMREQSQRRRKGSERKLEGSVKRQELISKHKVINKDRN